MLCLQKSAYAREKIAALAGFALAFPGSYFKEFTISLPAPAAAMNRRLLQHKIIGGLDLSKHYPELGESALFSVTETRTRAEIDALVAVLEGWS